MEPHPHVVFRAPAPIASALVLRSRLAVIACLVAVVAVAGACSGSSSTSRATTTVARTVATTAAPSTAPTTTIPAKATGGAPTTEDAVNALIAAWTNHDIAAASRIADAVAVMGIFSTPATSMSRRGCTPDDTLDEGGCIFWAGDGLVQFNTERRAQGWVVVSAQYDTIGGGDGTSGDSPDGIPSTTTTSTVAPTTTLN